MDRVAVKDDRGKPRMDLVPGDALRGAAAAFEFGATKYGVRNWELGMPFGRIVAALLRHVFAWMCGEELDDESGLRHLDHATACVLMLSALALRFPNTEYDDRKTVGDPDGGS